MFVIKVLRFDLWFIIEGSTSEGQRKLYQLLTFCSGLYSLHQKEVTPFPAALMNLFHAKRSEQTSISIRLQFTGENEAAERGGECAMRQKRVTKWKVGSRERYSAAAAHITSHFNTQQCEDWSTVSWTDSRWEKVKTQSSVIITLTWCLVRCRRKAFPHRWSLFLLHLWAHCLHQIHQGWCGYTHISAAGCLNFLSQRSCLHHVTHPSHDAFQDCILKYVHSQLFIFNISYCPLQNCMVYVTFCHCIILHSL